MRASERWRRVAWPLVAACIGIVVIPIVASDFVLLQIVIKSLWLGIAGASLAFLIGQAGLISLGQTAIFGTAGYMMAILTLSYGLNIWLAAACAVASGPVAGLLVGLLSSRSSGLYLMMLTLAVGVFAFFFGQQYQPITRGHTGFNGFESPIIGGVDFNERRPLFYVTAVAAVLVVILLRYVTGSPVGLAFRGLRDNRKRLSALGYNPAAVTIAAFGVSGVAAGIGGVLSVWYNGAISPGSIDITRIIELLVVVTIGGAIRIEGAFLGALAVTLLRNFASDFTNRVETLVGAAFIIVVLFSRHGILGLWLEARSRAPQVLETLRGQLRLRGRAATGPPAR